MGAEVSANIHEKYVVRETCLGQGTFASVHKGRRKEDMLAVAVKVMRKKHLLKQPNITEKLQREVQIMQEIDHENCVQFHDVFLSKSFVFIVIEYMRGGDLLDFLNERARPLPEDLAKKYFSQTVRGLQYLHERGIVHRDIKPENLLLSQDRQTIKIADFGLSNKTHGAENMLFYTMCGSLTHIAPEIFGEHGYDHRVDIWALGVVLFVMLSVSYPFTHPNRSVLIDLICNGEVYFEDKDPIWEDVSTDVKDLISLILTVDAEQRITISQCFEHPWLSTEVTEPVSTEAAEPRKKNPNFTQVKSLEKLASKRGFKNKRTIDELAEIVSVDQNLGHISDEEDKGEN